MKLKKIKKYKSSSLTSYRRIQESKGALDIVNYEPEKSINFDYEWKRFVELLSDNPDDGISPITKPHRTIADVLGSRRTMQGIRKHGYEASLREVLRLLALEACNLRNTGGVPVTVVRMLLRGIQQGYIAITKMKDVELIRHVSKVWQEMGLNEQFPDKQWSPDDCKKAHNGKWMPGVLKADALSLKLIDQLVVRLGGDTESVRNLLFDVKVFSQFIAPLIELIVRALLVNPSMNRAILNKEPFRTLFLDGRLPDREMVLSAFPDLTEELIEQYCVKPVTPGTCPSYDRKTLKHLFYLAGVPLKHCDGCARVLIAPSDFSKLSRKNPSWKKCRNQFVHALFQAGMNSGGLNSADIYEKLERFGVTRRKINELQNNHRFSMHRLRNTEGNRKQIREMAAALRCDPRPFFGLLLEPVTMEKQ